MDVILEGSPVPADCHTEDFLDDVDQIPQYDPFVPESVQHGERASLTACHCCRSKSGEKTRSRRNRTFSSVPDATDPRDHLADFNQSLKVGLPDQVDLRAHLARAPPESSPLSSCVAGAIASAFHFDRQKRHWERWADFVPSLRFINFNLRYVEASSPDKGTFGLRDGIKSVKLWGVCPQSQWPYDDSKLEERPPPSCYRTGKTFRATGYKSVQQTLPQLKGCLAMGQPFVFGFVVHSSFNSLTVELAGEMSLPEGDDDSVEGGHAACAVGYSDVWQSFILYNSWGSEWGDGGCFYMPYDYIMDPRLAYDFWTISWVGNETPEKQHCAGSCAPM